MANKLKGHLSSLISNLFGGHMREVGRGASTAYVLKVTGAGLAYGFNIVLARLVNPAGLGIFSLAQDIINLAAVFGVIGLDIASLRLISKYSSLHDWLAVKNIHRIGMVFVVLASCLSALVLFLSAPWLAETVFSMPGLTPVLRWMVLAIVPMSLYNLNAESLRGLMKIAQSQFVQGVCVYLVSLLGVYWFVKTWGLVAASWIFIIASMIAAVLAIQFWNSSAAHPLEKSTSFKNKDLFQSSTLLFQVALLGLVMNRVGSISLGLWHSEQQVGIFAAAYRTAWLISFFVSAANSIAAPKFGQLYHLGDYVALGATVRRTGALTALLSSPITLAFVFFPEWVLSVFGVAFKGGATALSILALGQLVHSFMAPVGFLLIMTGNEKLMRKCTFIAASMGIILSVILIPPLGVIGAAIATSAGLATLNFANVYFAWSRLKIRMLPDFRRYFHTS